MRSNTSTAFRLGKESGQSVGLAGRQCLFVGSGGFIPRFSDEIAMHVFLVEARASVRPFGLFVRCF